MESQILAVRRGRPALTKKHRAPRGGHNPETGVSASRFRPALAVAWAGLLLLPLSQAAKTPPSSPKAATAGVVSRPLPRAEGAACLGPLIWPSAPGAATACDPAPLTPGPRRQAAANTAPPAPTPKRNLSLVKTLIFAGSAAAITGLIVWATAPTLRCPEGDVVMNNACAKGP